MTSDASPLSSRPFEGLRRLDLRVIVPAALLVAIGLVSIASSKPGLFAAQARWAAAGLALAAALQFVPYRRVLDFAWPLYAVAIALLVLVLVPGIGVVRNGAQRWIDLGPVGFQPSEVAKVAHVLVLASYIRFRRDHRTWKGLFVPFALTLLPMVLVMREPDLGTALLMVPVLFALLWVAGARTKHLLLVVALGAASLPVLWSSLPEGHYQRGRVQAFLPASLRTAAADAPKVDTYQRDEAIAAVAGGGLLGQGFREGRQNVLRRVPENWTDFIFVVHAEEWGFAGVASLLLCLAALLGSLAMLASEIREPAGRLLCVGAMVLLGSQACVNLGMTMGLLPITGVPLPFVSYGGSAMLTAWLLLGLALHARTREPMVFSTGDFD